MSLILNYLLLAMYVKHTARLELLHKDVHCLIITSLGDGSKLNYVLICFLSEPLLISELGHGEFTFVSWQ